MGHCHLEFGPHVWLIKAREHSSRVYRLEISNCQGTKNKNKESQLLVYNREEDKDRAVTVQ